MTSHLRPAFVLLVLTTLILGLAFPLGFVGVGAVVAPFQAGGSLIRQNGVVIGSALLGQTFTKPWYFQPRPSAAGKGYDATSSGGSNLGPTSAALATALKARVATAGPAPIPADSVTASASGLDPDISPANAARQVARVAAARHLPVAQVQSLLDQHVVGRLLGFIGEPHVNVLGLNIALDAASPPPT
ncbi:potassium-transporting ATPase subunit KdpC [Acidisoma cladoniae]|jgi:K+-transporting ATPase ATPase C chain|uniref:potassium-transporting ATPase subunit KdpC n=1 Tax=Acidisoma cladoniae TaxID=3040935 RepID=UPI00254F9CC9|nr:potassium-transporting ATPase subunit KdpC [Acidisoma sp. PAMC 29798]